MDGVEPDRSSPTNRAALAELLAPIMVCRVLHLGRRASCARRVKGDYKKVKIVLAEVLRSGIFAPVLLNEKAAEKNTVDSPCAEK